MRTERFHLGPLTTTAHNPPQSSGRKLQTARFPPLIGIASLGVVMKHGQPRRAGASGSPAETLASSGSMGRLPPLKAAP
jgi:hypothetical protein